MTVSIKSGFVQPACCPDLDAHTLQAFELLGEADAVIANLLQDPTDQVARVQAQLWQRELDDL